MRFDTRLQGVGASMAAALLVLAACAAPQAAAQSGPAPDLREGADYTLIERAQPFNEVEGQVEVAEVFQYGCGGCFASEPHIREWSERKPDYVSLVRLPVSWNELARVHAQGYYTAEALGKVEEMHQAFFNEIHVEGNTLDNETALAEFFGRFGVDEQTFTDTFNSFSVHAKVQRADELIRRYGVRQTPSIVVDGRYLTTGSSAGSYEQWFEIVDALAARQHESE